MPLFEWCGQPPRRWLAENPGKAIPTFRIQRRVPEILAAARAAELFAYAETYAGERERGQPGALIPYLAPATFAGLWPSLGDGEIWRVGHLRDLSRVIDLEVGAIRLGPEFTTTGFMRTVTIQPNLTLWLRAYSTKMLGGRHSN